MRKHLLAIPIAALAVAFVGGAPAQAHGHGGTTGAITPVGSKAPAAFFTAKLNGFKEVPAANGDRTGDRNGSAVAFIKVKGNRISYAVAWKGISAPTLGHLHQGVAGVNGDVKATLFDTPMPDTIDAAAGRAAFEDPATAIALRANPRGFYLNLHTAQFKGGAVRGQLTRVNHPVNLLKVLFGHGAPGYGYGSNDQGPAGESAAYLNGEQEVPTPGNNTAGDSDGYASALIRAHRGNISFFLSWMGITAPTAGHLHEGPVGVNGPVRAELFTTPIPANVVAIAGHTTGAPVDAVANIENTPENFYANLHTAEFKDGAVRGQLARITR